MEEKFAACFSARDDLALHAELEGVERVDDGLRDHACKAAGDELRGLGDGSRVAVAFKGGNSAFAGLRDISKEA